MVRQNLRQAVEMVVTAVAKSVFGKDWKHFRFSRFQYDTAVEMLKARYSKFEGKSSQILVAGVGSGKTIAFAIPVLVSSTVAHLSGEIAPPVHLLLYPRTALAQDQFKTIEGFARRVTLGSLQVHLEHYSWHQ